MSLAAVFERMKRHFGSSSATSADLRLEESLVAKTSDNVAVTVPFALELKIIDRKAYKRAGIADDMAKSLASSALRQAVAEESFSGLQQNPGQLCEKALESAKTKIEEWYGLRLLDVAMNQAVAPQLTLAPVSGSASAAATDYKTADSAACRLRCFDNNGTGFPPARE
jgi:regulator of protease activity HflC (stomatin/prohibitin superfamily)